MKNKKDDFVDDGRVIAPMDIDGMPKRFTIPEKKKVVRQKEYDVTKNEKRQLILAAYKAFLPVLICGLVGFAITILLIYLWLK